MLVQLAYGRGKLPVEVPDFADVIEPRYTPPHPEPLEALHQALANPIDSSPLKDLIRPSDRLTIVHCDGTRPMPNAIVLKALGEVFDAVGLPDSQVTLLNALGTHRRNTLEELEEILGDEAMRRYQSEQSRSIEREHMRFVGRIKSGIPIEIHKTYLEADIRILLGFIEPHFFAGFSAGPKLVVPGVASQETVQHVHSAALIGSPAATWGVLEGNPLWESLYEAAYLAPPTFIVNLALNRDKEITAVFAGDLTQAHRRGVAYVRERAMQGVKEAYDIVLTTNSGYPLDQNLYQAVKGMSAAARIVKPGGSIIMTSECIDGIPDHGAFWDIVKEGKTVEGIMSLVASPGFQRPDQWQAQILAMVKQKARVFLYSQGISESQARTMLLEPVHDVTKTLYELLDEAMTSSKERPRIAVLPEGPQTMPYLQEVEL